MQSVYEGWSADEFVIGAPALIRSCVGGADISKHQCVQQTLCWFTSQICQMQVCNGVGKSVFVKLYNRTVIHTFKTYDPVILLLDTLCTLQNLQYVRKHSPMSNLNKNDVTTLYSTDFIIRRRVRSKSANHCIAV